MAVNTKQQVSINNIVSGIAAKRPELGTNVPTFTVVEEGTNAFLMSETWPTIKLGRDGGIDIPDLRSYPDGLEAAIHADQLFAKQTARDQKKAADKAAADAKAAQPATPASAPVQTNETVTSFQTGPDAVDQSETIESDQTVSEEAGEPVSA